MLDPDLETASRGELLARIRALEAARDARGSPAHDGMESPALPDGTARLRSIVSQNTVGVVQSDGRGCFRYVNDRYCEITGRTREELLGGIRAEDITHPDDAARDAPLIERMVATGEPFVSEKRYLRPDGGTVWVMNSITPVLGAEGRVVGGTAVCIDVTEHRRTARALGESEARYRTLFESVDEGVCVLEMVVDATGKAVDYRFLETNAAFERHTGLVDAVGKTARQLLPDLEPEWVERYGAVAATGEPVRFRQGSAVMGRWFDVYATPIGPRAARQVALLFRDISEARRAEELLREATRTAEQASQAKSQFLAVVSHELRTPLTGVIGFADLLETEVLGPVTPRQQEALARIKASSWHLVAIIDEILILSRAEAGKEEVRPAGVELGGIAREIVAILEPQADAHGLALRVEGAAAPVRTWTDPGKVRQILINLAGNAVKYTGSGEVSLHVDNCDAEWIRLHVRDTGPGIDPADQERIFEAFTQVDSSHTRGSEGTGLGLAICRRLAHLLGGDVTLQSAPGKGSTFTLRLPRRDGPR